MVLGHVGAILTNGHFVYTNDEHGDTYVDKDRLSRNPIAISMLAASIASDLKKLRIQVVVAPALGAIVLGHWTAYHLSSLSGYVVESIIAAKENGSFVLRPNEPGIVSGKRVLVVEDVLRTGKSARDVVDLVRREGGEVLGLAAIANRGKVTLKDVGNVPMLHALVELNMSAWDPKVYCPLCEKDVPINTNAGKGAEFLRSLAST